MIAITRAYHFSASHRLHLDSLTQEQNENLYGKCNNPFGHGHNYRLEVTVAGPVHPQTGQILALTQLDQLVQDKVLDLFDHRNINLEIPEFASRVPTTENVLAVIGERLQQDWDAHIAPPVQLYRLHVQETGRNGFESKYPISLWQD